MTRTLDIEHLTELLLSVQTDDPVAIGVCTRADGLELAVKRLTAADPAGDLLGLRAPPSWSAFAVLSPGQLSALDRSVEGLDVRVAHVVARDGRVATHVDGHAVPALEDGPQGWLTDLCRRVLGLPTPPPDTTTAELLAAIWLDRLLIEILDADLDEPPPDWDMCRSLLAQVSDDRVEGFGLAFARRWPWAIVRRYASDLPLFGLEPEAARWLDDGAYSRYVMSGFPPIGELRDDVTELLGPAAAHRVHAVLDRWLVEPDH